MLTFWGGASGIRMHGMGRPSYGHAKEIKAMQLALERLVPLDAPPEIARDHPRSAGVASE